jgi:hypothetical protein
MDSASPPRVGRPRTRDNQDRQYIGFQLPILLKGSLERAARANGRSVSAEAVGRLDQSFAEAAYPPEVAAIAELIARAMAETGASIEGMNRWSGHGYTHWIDDPYAYDQSVKAAMWVLVQSRPPGSRAPHGLPATADFRPDRARQMGKQIADGLLEVMRGRHQDEHGSPIIPAPWIDRVRTKLGTIWERLRDWPEPKQYWVSPHSVSDGARDEVEDAEGRQR